MTLVTNYIYYKWPDSIRKDFRNSNVFLFNFRSLSALCISSVATHERIQASKFLKFSFSFNAFFLPNLHCFFPPSLPPSMISFSFYTFSIFSSLSVSTVYRGIILLSAFVFHFEINFLDNFCVNFLFFYFQYCTESNCC